MTKPLRNWMRVVLPRGEVGLLVILGMLLIDGAHLWIVWQQWPVAHQLAALRVGWLSLAAFAYGIYRAVVFHPLCDADYRRWLEFTPWNADRPLPAGPLWLMPQDLVVIAAIIGLNHEFTPLNFIIPIAFLGGYLLVNLILNWLAGEWALAFAAAFGLAGLPLLHAHWEYILPVEILCLGISYWATRRSLRHFPWKLSTDVESQFYKSAKDAQQQLLLGWPFDELAPKPPKIWIPVHDGICLSVLVGWLELTLWTLFVERSPNPVPAPMLLLVTIPTVFASLVAFAAVTGRYSSPIDVWGRIRTGRWLIPGYDIMAAAPFAASLVSIALHATLRIEYAAVGTAMAALLLLVFSPKVEEWRLTGKHRMSFARNSQEFIQL